ncbi:MAG: hypothetical protein CMI09_13465 [Oceanospirillaceae bacterium]|nr:hypothetical protein [Oceanospirillaceae bacterium]|tara:strand:+ start:1203 stop:2399 length:1197 start_codon:yes stop_codon:yes gene_type:complete
MREKTMKHREATRPGNRLSRRQLLQLSGASALGLVAWGSGLAAAASRPGKGVSGEIWFSAQGRDASEYSLSWLTDGKQPVTAASGFRGHGAASDPVNPRRLVMFARRPGWHGLWVDVTDPDRIQTFEAAPGCFMHGHGCFSADGQWVFSTESEIESGVGKVVVRDSQTLAVERVFDSGGIGPHDLALMPNGQHLVVANGGLLTHPDTGRKVLNLDSMRSTLSYLDIESGQMVEELTLPYPKASIRHLDVAPNGTVAVATQLQREAMRHDDLVPLAALHQPGSSRLMELQGPEPLLARFNDYMGSVRINPATGLAGFTSPRGNLAGFWDIHSGELAGYHAFFDVCGLTVSADQQRFVLSNSAGEIRQLDARTLTEHTGLRQRFNGLHWDNHLFTIRLPG